MALVALKRLTWGDREILPGEPVPEGEEGRDYASLLRSGRIVEAKAPEEMSDEQLVAEVERLKAENEKLAACLEIYEEPLDVPEDVTPGETRGWPVDEEGEPYKLPEPVRQLISDLETEVAELHADLASEEGESESEQTSAEDGEEGSGDGEPEAETGAAETESASSGDGDLPEGVKPVGGGYYLLPDGSKVRGRKAVDQALAASAEDGEEGSGD